jgi:hypothetical protein
MQSSLAQTHNEVWVKYNFYTTINAKFSVSVDLNYRQQANIFSNNKNIFSLPLMRSSRLWLFYNLPKKYAIVSAGFIGKTYDRTNPDADLTNATEARFAIGLIKKYRLKIGGTAIGCCWKKESLNQKRNRASVILDSDCKTP